MSEINREQVSNWIRQEKAKAIFKKKFTHLDKNLNTITEPLIYFKPKIFGKSSTKYYVNLLGLKTKEDCEKLNQELYP